MTRRARGASPAPGQLPRSRSPSIRTEREGVSTSSPEFGGRSSGDEEARAAVIDPSGGFVRGIFAACVPSSDLLRVRYYIEGGLNAPRVGTDDECRGQG